MKTIKKASLLFASLALVLGAGLVGNSDTKEVKAASATFKKVTSDADLTDAVLEDANLEGADLEGANLTGTKLKGAFL